MLNKKSLAVLLAALLMEGLLVLVWLAWRFKNPVHFPINFNLTDFYIAVLAILPLLALNYLIFLRKPKGIFAEFLKESVLPLCQNLSILTGAIISIAAGIGEELFFRDFLFNSSKFIFNLPSAVIISSVAFGFIHFLGKIQKYYLLVIIYSVIGIYFSMLAVMTNNIFVVILTHSLYDFLAICFVKWKFK